jgi:type IV secretory pathway VirB2 component (pilin)
MQKTRKMKFFQQKIRAAAISLACLFLAQLSAQTAENAPVQDFMRQTGKIYVVVAVIVLIFIGLVIWLARMDRKLTNIEHQIFQDNER